MRYLSPLRYPGGKARLAPFLKRLVAAQSPQPKVYAEPFAGGVGAGLRLLADGDIERLLINDVNPGVAAFWRSCVYNTQELSQKIETTPVTIDTWHQQRDVYFSPLEHSDLDLGFATFFLNRTNRSGILTARPIGGLSQNGKWGLNSRYNTINLVKRIELIGNLRSQIEVFEKDAQDFLRMFADRQERILFYIDPPYLEEGGRLYLSQFSLADHQALRDQLEEFPQPWVLTYDDDKTIAEELYAEFRLARFSIAHTANVNHIGSEIIAFSDNVKVPDLKVTRRSEAVALP